MCYAWCACYDIDRDLKDKSSHFCACYPTSDLKFDFPTACNGKKCLLFVAMVLFVAQMHKTERRNACFVVV